MFSVHEKLPELVGARSRTVIFIAGQQKYAGHFKKNGWFYCDESAAGVIKRAYSPLVARDAAEGDIAVSSWEYLRDAALKVPTEFDLRIAAEAAQRTSYFTVGDIGSERIASLDILTPMHIVRFAALSEGEQIALHSMIVRMANHPLGTVFPPTWIPLNCRQSTRSHMAAVCERLTSKRVLLKSKEGFRLLNPGFELWMRMRNLHMKDYFSIASKVCPVLLNDDKMSPSEFWEELCTEAGVSFAKLPSTRRSPSADIVGCPT